MGSRIMHYAIGIEVSKQLKLGELFILGNIAPDVNKNTGSPKELTHFMGIGDSGKNELFPNDFLNKYRNQINDEFIFGYYAHLLADNIWLKTMNWKYISGNNVAEKLKSYYNDFVVYNQILIEEYNLSTLTFNQVVNSGIAEIIDSDLILLIDDLNSDFNYSNDKLMPIFFEPFDIETYFTKAIAKIVVEYKRLI